MIIAINTDNTVIQRLNQTQNETFIELSKIDSHTNAVVIIRDNPQADMELAVSAGCPVIVIAGTMDEKGKEFIRQAREYMIPDACIVVKNGDRIETLDKMDLGKAVGGIGIRAVLTAVKNAVTNNMVPDILLWRENPPQVTNPKQSAGPMKVAEPAVEKTPSPEVKTRVPRTYREFIDLYDYVFCLVMDTDGSQQIKELAEALNAVHVNCGNNNASRLYGNYENNMSYAYEKDKTIMMPGGTRKAVVQASLDTLDINDLEMFLNNAKSVVHVTSGDKILSTKEWLESGYKLNAVISDKAEKCSAVLNNRVPVSSNALDIAKHLEGF